jgi:hypothetical protein
MSAYEEYFRRQWYTIATDADGRYVAARKVEDIFAIVPLLVQGHHRDVIVSRLKQSNPVATDSACESSIDLAARLLLMIKIGVVKHQASPWLCLKWEKGNLVDFVRERFNEPQVLDCHQYDIRSSYFLI